MNLRQVLAGSGIALVFLASGTLAQAQGLVKFSAETQAVTYCQGGGVVWLDFSSAVYVYKGSPRYGKGRDSAYVCEADALAAGAHPARVH